MRFYDHFMTAEMPSVLSFESVPTTEPELLSVLHELSLREPIFHRPEFASNRTEFDRMMADDYWEFGASGQRYTRNFILRALETQPEDAAEAGWEAFGFHCRRLASQTYILTYTLLQGERTTRRATIWRESPMGWQILFHQGTLVQNV
jgi:hypothetical protein